MSQLSRVVGRKGVRIAALLAGAGIVLAVILVAAHRLGPKHLLTVAPGHLHRSGLLTPDELAEVVDRRGVRTVVNLRSQLENERGDWHAVQASLLREKQVELLDLPMHSGHPPDDAVLEAWLALLDDESRHPILVHCEYGVVRTGLMVAVYEMEHRGRSNEEAWAAVERFGEIDEPVRSHVREWLMAYEPRARRGGAQGAPPRVGPGEEGGATSGRRPDAGRVADPAL